MKRLSFVICLFYLMLSTLATTVVNGQQDYFTEQFFSGANTFDLSNKAIMFTPDGTSYTACLQQIGQLPTDPAGGIDLELPDDDFVLVHLVDQETVSIYGSSFSSFYVGSNGYITFTKEDWDHSQSLSDHFDTKRISALFNDFNPSAGGMVSWKYIANGVAVTWWDVPEYGMDNSNTFQVEMYFDGRIRLAWLVVASEEGIVGLSEGLGLPADFQQTDLSAYPPCGGGPPIGVTISGYVRSHDGSGISGVLLDFSPDGGSTFTDASGYYGHTVEYGWTGIVTPSKDGYIFNPSFMLYDVAVTSDISDQNYTGWTELPPSLDNPTEQFSSDADPFDLSYKAIMFTPSADGRTYSACLQEITELPIGGTQLALDDDGYEYVRLEGQKTVLLHGQSFDSFYVGSNGYITFTEGDAEYSGSLPDHFNTMRISGLFHDFDPSMGGVVSYKQFADRIVVTWWNVPEYRTGGSNTFQVEMYFDGRIRLAWLAVDATTGIVGLSDGLRGWVGFQEANFSAYPPCGDGAPIGVIISGHVRDPNGQGIKDVLLTFSDDGGSTTTDVDGYYSNTVWPGWSGIVRPSKSGYIFEPPHREYDPVVSHTLEQDYIGMVRPSALDYFTEAFTSSTDAFDLLYQSIMFSPNGDATSYTACIEKITQLPTDPEGGIDLDLSDDSYWFVRLTDQKIVSFFGHDFSGFYVGSNGYITFAEGDMDNRPSFSDHFAKKRISVLFNDFDPSVAGSVSWKQLPDRVAVTWQDISLFHPFTINPFNTFQIEMYFDGRIRLAWLGVQAITGIVGLSDGLGLPADFEETDLSSMYPPCEVAPPITPTISGYVRQPDDSGIPGVRLDFSNDGGGTFTDSSGYYSHEVEYGWTGVVTPSKDDYTFDPPSILYSEPVTSDISDQDYTGFFGPPPNYFTEHFSSETDPFDLSYKAIMFTPTDGSYEALVQEITSLPTDPVGGEELALADDGYEFVSLNDQKTVSIYGSSFPSFYVGSNGYITFTEGDVEWRDFLSHHFATTSQGEQNQRISALFNDFNPSAAGVVSWKQEDDRAVVTWQDVPGYGTTNSNTFQVEMYFDGRIRLAWLAVDSVTGIVGLSQGLGLPADFQETDLSQAQPGGPGPGGVPSLVGHWKMDDNAADTTVLDSSGRGNHGTAQRNTSVLSTIGIIDGALTFDGTSDYIDCGSSAILQQKQTLTVSAWINGSSFAKPMNMIVCGDKRNLDFCWGLRIDNSVAKFFVRAGSYYAATGPTVSDNQWYHVVGVWDRNGGPNNLRIYVDGSLEGTATVNADMDADTVYVTIGRLYYPTVNQYFDGLIDDVRIYNRVLSDTEIAALP